MKLQFLGTGSATRYPAAWCDCMHCNYARAAGGKNVRAASSALLDDDVLLDMNGETIGMADRLGARLLDVDHLLITHIHGDHFVPEWLVWRRMEPGIDRLSEQEQRVRFASRYTPLPLMTICGNRHVRERLDTVEGLSLALPNQSLAYRDLEPGVTHQLKKDLLVTPVYAEHVNSDFTYNYIVQRGGKTLLYALDTGGYQAESLSILARFRYDAIVMEGTFGPVGARQGHMTLEKNLEMYRFFLENALFHGQPRFYLSHLSPHWTPPHDAFAEMVAPYGLQVAYDGLVIEI